MPHKLQIKLNQKPNQDNINTIMQNIMINCPEVGKHLTQPIITNNLLTVKIPVKLRQPTLIHHEIITQIYQE